MKKTLASSMLAFLLAAGTVRADTAPTRWSRAQDPEAAAAFDLHRVVQQRLLRTAVAAVDFGEHARVLAMLERAGAERSKNPLLRFDLGHVYWLLDNHPRAAEVLQSAVAEFPDHPAVEQAWLRLALACGHTGDHECEQRAYATVLRIETEEARRVTPTLNLAETRMHLGELNEAVEGYREVLRSAARLPPSESAPLATWGLAVALDRGGDSAAAEKEARFALEIERSMGLTNLLTDKEIVFFSPAYEVHWYVGLGYAAVARTVASARGRALLWRRAETSFGEYVKAGESKRDRWLAIAKARLAMAKRERERAEKEASSAPVANGAKADASAGSKDIDP